MPRKAKKPVFICVDRGGQYGIGDSLNDAWESYNLEADEDLTECTFYSAIEVKVKHHIVEVVDLVEET